MTVEATREEKVAAVERLLTAMNAIAETGVPMTAAQIESLFTEDCRMVLNGQPICEGHAGLLAHALDIQNKLRHWRFNLPFDRILVEGEDVFVYYTCEMLARDDSRGRVYDMCIYAVRDGRIRDVCEVVHFAGHQVSLDSFP
jgi:hypothetical protein